MPWLSLCQRAPSPEVPLVCAWMSLGHRWPRRGLGEPNPLDASGWQSVWSRSYSPRLITSADTDGPRCPRVPRLRVQSDLTRLFSPLAALWVALAATVFDHLPQLLPQRVKRISF